MYRNHYHKSLIVRHRIDGLESVSLPIAQMLNVRHRIDGLEIIDRAFPRQPKVRHRIDGLETQQNLL